MNEAKISVLISGEEIRKRVAELGAEISRDYKGKALSLICVLKGGVIFLADLARKLELEDIEIDFMGVSSYGGGLSSSGAVRITLDLGDKIEGKDVLLVEDIVDTGRSLAYLMAHLRRQNPASLRLCALLDKPSRRVSGLKPDYCGFSVPDKFVVGYGLDFAQKYRNLDYIGVIE